MSEHFKAVTLDMFQPQGKSTDADAKFSRMVKFLYGPAGEEFAGGLRDGVLNEADVERYRERIDNHFLNVFKDQFQIHGYISPESAYMSAQGVATSVVRYGAQLSIPHLADKDLFRNEVAIPSPSPIDLYYYLARPTENRQLSFHARRHLLLSLVSAGLDARSGNGRLGMELQGLQRTFNERLFAGDEAPSKTINLFAYHHPETNTVKRIIMGIPQPSQNGDRVIEHSLRVRTIEDLGWVQTDIREKDLVKATMKALSKAVTSNGIVRPEMVDDHMGIMFVAFEAGDPKKSKAGKVSKRERLIQRVEAVLRENRPVKEVVEDDYTEKDRGQAEMMFKRLQVYLEGKGMPYEMVFFDQFEFLNQKVEVGVKDPETRFYNGRAHELYERRRAYPALSYLLPRDFYENVDPQGGLVRQMEEVAKRLMTAVNVFSYNPHNLLRIESPS